jgi:hypothetical protein
MTSQSNEVREYLVKQYVTLELLDGAGNKIIPEGRFDPFVYPSDGYIPYCKQCQSDFETFKTNYSKHTKTAEMEHNWNCIWYSYFAQKISSIQPSIRIVPSYVQKKS